jgi:cell division protein FtsI (penicillin-binding protein 3)
MLPRGRLRQVEWLMGVWLVAVCLRLGQVQLVEHGKWQEEAARQQEKTIDVEEPRGDIVSHDGRLLAASLERVAVYANPRQIARAHWSSVAARLSPLIGQPADQILRSFAEHDGFFYIAKDLDPVVSGAVAQLRQRGVGTLRTERRIYPQGTLAAPVIGFVDGEGKGQAGLEGAYERTLRGVPSVYRLLRDGKSLPTPLDLRLEKPGRPGLCLILSLDSRVQTVIEQELAATLDEVGGKGAAAVVMDVNTGEILGLASLPSYDPARPGDSPAQQRRDIATETALEPGSLFKPFIVAAAIEAGVLNPNEVVDCSGGGVQVAGTFIHDHATYGFLPVRDVLAHSSNAGAIRIAQRLSPAQLGNMIVALGFGRPTGVELPGETSGIYRGPSHWSALSQASLALGQEIAASPLQVAQAYAALANGGFLVHPTIVRETRDRDGAPVIPYHPPARHRVIAADVAHTVAGMLTAVVDEGTATAAQLSGYRVGGKTGTAQLPLHGGYAAGRHAAWFAGFLPLPNPRLVIVVCVDQPRVTYWAAEVAAPAFGRIAARLVTLLAIPPTAAATT